ncbi:MAG: CARDB domain-containing protein, partial [Bacteroidales bacterium]
MDININVGSADELYVFDGPNMESKQIKGSPFAGQNIPSILRKLQASTENTSGALSFAFISDPANGGTAWEADISCVQLAPNDMAGLTLKGEVLPLLGTAYPYEVVVKNEGLETQTNFKVNLFAGTANNIVKSTSINRSLASGDTMHLTFTWTPQTVGSTPLGVSVELAGDGNTQNDKSKPYIVNVQSQSTVTTEIKNLADLTTMFVPVCFFYPHSVTQSIYKASEINLAKGKITALRYYNSFQNEISNEHIIIHVVETNNSDLAGGWIPVAQMKKVYDGIFTFPSGKNEITIALDSTFDYKGGNLIVRFEHPMSQYNYTIADAFSILYDLKNDYRTLHYGSFTDVFNEKNSEIKAQSFYPSILFAMDVKGAAAIKGTISCKGLPVDSVVVKIKGTSFVAVTNPKGEYAFPSLNPATYILEC